MKLSKLNIEQYKHLENLDFDFTYPEDFHIVEKRGKPLDKICFIGQSATGKTSLLELIEQEHSKINNLMVSKNTFSLKNDFFYFSGSITFKDKKYNFHLNKDNLIFDNKKNLIELKYSLTGTFSNLLSDEDKKFIFYFKSNLISEKNIELFTKNPIDIFEKHPKLDKRYNINNFHSKETPVVFDDNVDINLWLSLMLEILDYRKRFSQKMSDLIHKGLLGNQKKLTEEFEKWQKENPNTLELFAEKFNPILEKLNLEVDVFNTEYSIPIKNKRNDEIIPIQNTSTGTKGLLLSFLPLYKLDTKDSLILIDEPERSLYPDMQMDLMEYYQNLASEAQFIIATHSPFIAASFEPEERFILYFDEEGKVAVRRGSSPIGDDPNDMLENDFDINYINKFGQKKHKEYLELKQQIFFEKDEKKKKEIAEKLEKIGEQYNF
jgi:predicted ATP-dependent endonuclease of OLD family